MDRPIFIAGRLYIRCISSVRVTEDKHQVTYVLDEQKYQQYRDMGMILPKINFLFTIEEPTSKEDQVGTIFELDLKGQSIPNRVATLTTQ